MKTLFLLGFAATLIMLSSAHAQQAGSPWGATPQDSIACRENIMIMTNAVRGDNFVRAREAWQAIWDNCPEASMHMYVYGSTIFRHLHSQETDPARRQEYFDKVLMLYDRSMEVFPTQRPRGIGLIHKTTAYTSMMGEEANQANIRTWLGEAIDIMGIEIPMRYSHAYWNYAAASMILFQTENLTREEYIADYFRIIDLLEQAIAAQENEELIAHLQGLSDGITGLFLSSGAGDCETMVNFYAPQVAENTDNLEFLNEVLGILASLGCRETDLFLTVAGYIHVISPTVNSSVAMAQRAQANGDLAASMRYWRQAAELEEDNVIASNFMLQVVGILNSQRNWAAARTAAQEALRLNPANGAAHILIAQMYAGTARDVLPASTGRTGLVFGAAIDQLNRAIAVDPTSATQARNLIRDYTQHLIDRETAFMMGLREGERVHIGGWINVYTTIQLR